MKTHTRPRPMLRRVSHHKFVNVMQHRNTGQKALHASRSFQPGDVVCPFSAGEVLKAPTYLTIQLNQHDHITLVPEFLQYTNHSCAPSAFFDTARMELICLTPLQPGDEITFFYPSTEWEMAQPFDCKCGSPACLGVIQGAANLSPDVLNKYALTEFIRTQLASGVPA